MSDPPKATKGRRMSKKTRKKSGNKSARKARPVASKSSAKRSAAKPARSSVTESSKTAKKSKTKAPRALASKAAKPAAKKPSKKTAAVRSVLEEGAKAPAFHLPRDGGDAVSLADYAGQKLVLFFYPRADTPGCTKEAIDFTRLAAAFADAGTAVVGVSADPTRAQDAFRDKHRLGVPLASDETHEMLEAYG